MTLNPYFTQGTKTEQSLVQDLINEQLRMYGVETFYIPRKYLTTNTIIREVVQSKFDIAYPLEAYVDNYDAYSGGPNLLTKFGLQVQDEVRLIISRERFEEYITPLIEDEQNIKLSTRPKSGDLIWFPLDDRVYEIKNIEYAKPYYQLQNLYVYELYCELFRYEDEVVDTNIEEIDNNFIEEGYIQTLTLAGTATTATAITTLVDTGSVLTVTMSNVGSGYTLTPTVAFSTAPSGGVTATGIATFGSYLDSVSQVYLTNPGSGYTVAPSVSFSSLSGSGAEATTTIGNGSIGIVTITSGGSGYTTVPIVTISGPVGTGTTATAVAGITTTGEINRIYITNAGSGYTSTPTITVGSPYEGASGSFVFNEIVTGSLSGTSARVKSFDIDGITLEVGIVTGRFIAGDVITGQESGATYQMISLEEDNVVNPYDDNDEFEVLGDDILDFTERNPFGMPT
tara:strand:+ start:4810 stop:6174 length:1365 start_codon:yes stop_codon:yes gene_type:complete